MGTVTDYLAGIDEPNHAALARVWDRARELVPDVVEGESYGMPALLYRGKALISVQAAAKHLGLYPFSGAILPALDAELTGFDYSPGAVRFSPEHPLPDALLDHIITRRRDQIDAQLDR